MGRVKCVNCYHLMFKFLIVQWNLHRKKKIMIIRLLHLCPIFQLVTLDGFNICPYHDYIFVVHLLLLGAFDHASIARLHTKLYKTFHTLIWLLNSIYLYSFVVEIFIAGLSYAAVADGVEIRQAPGSPLPKSTDLSPLLLVEIPGPESSKENSGVMWTSSPDRLEDPRKPFQYSNSSGSPCFSESGSDIYNKREVIQKLRQQLKRRDEMIAEMQAQIVDLKNSLVVQVTQTTNLQSQLDAASRELFESEREIQHLRKIIADHCVAEALSHDKPLQAGHWQSDATNGHANGYADSSVDDPDLHYIGIEKRKGEVEKVEMLKREVCDLKEVIEGKDFLIQSYKEQKLELCGKIRELQEKLSAQIPNIL